MYHITFLQCTSIKSNAGSYRPMALCDYIEFKGWINIPVNKSDLGLFVTSILIFEINCC